MTRFTGDTLIELSKRPLFNLGPYEIVSQQPEAISDADRRISASYCLPAFMRLWAAIEKATGYRWKSTSYIRFSPSHELGHSFDLAPDIAPSAEHLYAVSKRSDPVLYKRATLIRKLQRLKHTNFLPDSSNQIGCFIEPDHLHIQIMAKDNPQSEPFKVVKWKVEKPLYEDTYSRMAMPLITT